MYSPFLLLCFLTYLHFCLHAQSLQLCPTLCNPVDYSLPGSSVHGIFSCRKATHSVFSRILEWVAIPFSRGSSRPRDQTGVFRVTCIARGFFITEPLGNLLLKYPSPRYFELPSVENPLHPTPAPNNYHSAIKYQTRKNWA